MLAIRALIAKSEQMKTEFIKTKDVADIVYEVASGSFGNNKLKNIFISAVILMSECGIKHF